MATDGFVQLPPDSTGKKVDNTEFSAGETGSDIEFRQRTAIGDPSVFGALAKVKGVDPAGSDNALIVRPIYPATIPNHPVTVTAALPTGANTIGAVTLSGTPSVIVTTLPSIPAGTNNIGDVDLASALPTGTNIIGGARISRRTVGDWKPLVAFQSTGWVVGSQSLISAPGSGNGVIAVTRITVSIGSTASTVKIFFNASGAVPAEGSNTQYLVGGNFGINAGVDQPYAPPFHLKASSDTHGLFVNLTGGTGLVVTVHYFIELSSDIN